MTTADDLRPCHYICTDDDDPGDLRCCICDTRYGRPCPDRP